MKSPCGIRPQPYVPAPSMDYNPLDPRFAPGRGDVEIEAVAIAVPAGFVKGFALRLLSFSMLPSFPYIFPHNVWDVMVFYGSLGKGQDFGVISSATQPGCMRLLWDRKSQQWCGDKLTTNGSEADF